MFRLLYLLLSSALLLQYIKCVSVYIEEGSNKKYVTSFELPVIDGINIRDNTIYTLEIRSLEPKDKNNAIKMIANFPKLQYFNLSNFELEVLPKLINLPLAELLIFESNDLTNITANSFSRLPKVKELYFTSNIIEEIENGAFGKSVLEVYLDCNLLKEIKKSWFQNPGVLEVLAIRHNKISFLDENLFQSFVKLTQIEVSNNEITTIGDGAFIGSHYNTLSIQGNQIAELKPSIFSATNVTIKKFNIGLNRMSYLAQDLLDKINVTRFLIYGNPWQCPCLKKITTWLIKRGVNETILANDRLIWSANNPVCIYALSFTNTCIEVVDNELYNSYLESLGKLEIKLFC